MPGNSAGSEHLRTGGGRTPRIGVVDALRGLAVLAMFEWHTAEAWVAEAERGHAGFVAARAIGGLAAPLFLLLAGVSLGLASPLRPTPAQTLASIRRGLRVVVAGYALSLFSWLVDHGACLDVRNLGVALTAVLAVLAALRALDDRARTAGERAALAVSAIAAVALTAEGLDAATRGAESLLPRLDVLHGIGAALVVTALALHASRSLEPAGRALALGTAALVIAAATVSAAGIPQRLLPAGVADWIARDPDDPGGFPLLPWAAYSLLGAALALAVRARPTTLSHAWALPSVSRPGLVALAALAVAALTWDYSPLAGPLLDASAPLRSLTRLVANASLALASAATFAALAPLAPWLADAITRLGRHSLVLYAAHLELAYGLAGIPLQDALSLGAWSAWLALLVIAMHALAREIDRRRGEHAARSAPRVETPR